MKPATGMQSLFTDPILIGNHSTISLTGNLILVDGTESGCSNSLDSVANRAIQHVAIYLRVSTKEQANEGDSLDTQLAKCLEQCSHKFGASGFTHTVFQDPGKSGASDPMPWHREPRRRCRKDLWALLQGLQAGRFTHICAISIDRIYRDRAAWTVLRREILTPRNIGIILVTEEVDDSVFGEFTTNMIAEFGELARKVGRERCQISLNKRKDEGYCLGTVPFGYRHELEEEKTHRRRNIVPVPEQMETVKRIFHLHDQGMTPPMIARQMSDEGVIFVKHGKPRGAWYENRVLNILKNPVYAGLIRAKDGSLVQGLHWDHRIIEPADHQRVLERVDMRRTRLKGPAASQPFRLFAGLLTCGHCGCRLRSSFHTATPDYRCFGQYRRRGAGAHVYVSARHLETAVLAQIEKVATSPGVLEEARERISLEIDEGLKPKREERQRVASALANIDSKQSRLVDAIADGMLKPEDARNRLDALALEREDLSVKARDLDRFLAGATDRALLYQRAIAALEDFPVLWETMEPLEKRELIGTCVEKLEARSDGSRVRIRIKIATLPEKDLALPRGRGRWTYGKPEGPEGLTPRQLAFLAHLKDGRKLREAAALMEVRESHVYRLRHGVYEWLQVRSDKEAVSLAGDWIEQNRVHLPMFGCQGKHPPGRHRRLKTMEYQILCLAAGGMSTGQIVELTGAPSPVVDKRLESALAKAGREDPLAASEEVRRLGLAPGEKTWQWGTRRRLSG